MANALNKVKTSGVEDDAISLAKMAPGTDGQVITYDASGNPVAVGPGTDGQVLTSTGAGSPPAFETLPTSGATLSGSTDDTVVTVTGANAMQGESALKFTSNYLHLNHANGGISWGTGTPGSFGTSPSIGIAEQAGYHSSGSAVNDLVIGAKHQKAVIIGTTSNASGGLTTRLSVENGGDVQVKTGNLVIGTAGKGILFDSHSAAHNLNDYEEGTFTATMGHSVTLTQSTLTYTKVGRMVHICGLLSVNDDNAHSHFTLQNLPFTAGAGYADLSCPATRINNWNVSTDTSWISGYTESNKIYFQQVRDNATATACEADSGGDMIINLTYFAA